MTFGPVATSQICRTLERILQREHPELGRIEVSVVEDDRQRRPRPAMMRQRDIIVDGDEKQPGVEGRRAA